METARWTEDDLAEEVQIAFQGLFSVSPRGNSEKRFQEKSPSMTLVFSLSRLRIACSRTFAVQTSVAESPWLTPSLGLQVLPAYMHPSRTPLPPLLSCRTRRESAAKRLRHVPARPGGWAWRALRHR